MRGHHFKCGNNNNNGGFTMTGPQIEYALINSPVLSYGGKMENDLYTKNNNGHISESS